MEYDPETVRAINEMIVAYTEMRDALGAVIRTNLDTRLCLESRDTHMAEIKSAKESAARVFGHYVRVVPIEVRRVVPLSSSSLLQEFEEGLVGK